MLPPGKMPVINVEAGEVETMMKKVVTVLALLGILASYSHADGSTAKDAKAVVSTYNQLADLTTVETRRVTITVGERSVQAQASYSYEGKVPGRPAEVIFRLSTVNAKQVWFEMDDFLYFKYGDKVAKGPVEMRLQMTTSAESSEATETLTARIPVDFYKMIFSAKEIILGIRGDKEPPFKSDLRENYPFDAASLAPFKELAKSIPPKK